MRILRNGWRNVVNLIVIWYIPSSKELVECAQAIVDYGLDEFNQIMSEYGYEALSGSLWSLQ